MDMHIGGLPYEDKSHAAVRQERDLEQIMPYHLQRKQDSVDTLISEC